MDDLTGKALDELTAEIVALNKKLAADIIRIGRMTIGPQASLKQIANLIGPQFGLEAKDVLCLFAFAHQAGETHE